MSEPGAGLPIQEVSRLLGVPAPTLRSWERRYGVPVTTRSPGGHRRYTDPELRQLRMFRDEVAVGHRASYAASVVRAWAEGGVHQHRVQELLAASDALRPEGVRQVLDASRDEVGLEVTVDAVLLPAMRQIGAWWSAGRCDEAQEHLTTEAVRGWLARVTAFAPPPESSAPVLLACGPRDLHSLGIEAFAALLADNRLPSRLLGARTPSRTLVTAADATGAAAVVVVSHLPSQRRPAVDALRALDPDRRPIFYAGNAFLFPASRKGVPGTYLGDNLGEAARTVRAALAS